MEGRSMQLTIFVTCTALDTCTIMDEKRNSKMAEHLPIQRRVAEQKRELNSG